MKVLTNLNLNKNELQNTVVQNLGTAPSSPGTGQIYTDTSGTPVLKYFNGTVWVSVGSGSGTVTGVTAGDSTITIGGTGAAPTVAVATSGITNTQVSASAAIAYSKLNLTGSVTNTDIASAAAIAYSKLTLTGSIVNADINSAAAIAFSKLASPLGSFSFNSQLLTNLATPVSTADAATKGYVDSAVQGLNPKAAVIAASTGNVSLATAPSTLDGITLAGSNRILLKDQTTASQNGIYVFSAGGAALTRATDMDVWTEVPAAYVWVETGTVNADTAFVCTSDPGGTLETTSIVWSKFANAAQLTASAPLVISGNNITLTFSTRVVLNGGQIDLQTGLITPGTYQSVTIDTYGRATAGGDLISGNGIAARTASGTYTARTITGTTNQITVTNGDGVAGNPTISLPTNARTSVNATGFYSAAGTGTASTFVITQATHGLGSSGNSYCDIICQCYDISANPAVLVFVDISISTSTGDVTFTFASSTTLSNYRFTIIGK